MYLLPTQFVSFKNTHLKSMFLVKYCQSVRNKDSLKWSGHRINKTWFVACVRYEIASHITQATGTVADTWSKSLVQDCNLTITSYPKSVLPLLLLFSFWYYFKTGAKWINAYTRSYKYEKHNNHKKHTKIKIYIFFLNLN